MFVCFIIRIFQLVFSAGTVFFSHNKSANSTFSHGFSAKRTGSIVQSTIALIRSVSMGLKASRPRGLVSAIDDNALLP
jgi:hypothetical protein